jgi:isopentenyl-diphosphate delta-isomerase type 1
MTSTDHELLYWVDEQDQVLGPCRRGDAHRQGLRHRAVHILVFNSAGQVFLQERSLSKDINPGLWDTSSAGHVDFGESYDQCAIRELREELGIATETVPERLFRIPASALTGWEFVEVYRIEHDGPLQLNPDEISDGRWVSPTLLDALIEQSPNQFTTSLRALWQKFRGSHPQASLA